MTLRLERPVDQMLGDEVRIFYVVGVGYQDPKPEPVLDVNDEVQANRHTFGDYAMNSDYSERWRCATSETCLFQG